MNVNNNFFSKSIDLTHFQPDFSSSKFPINSKNEDSLFKSCFETVMGKQMDPLDEIDQWVYEVIKLAKGIKTTDLKHAEQLIENLKDKIGFSNAYLLLSRSYQLAYQTQSLNENNWKEKNDVSNAVHLFDKYLKLLGENQHSNTRASLLQANYHFNKADVDFWFQSSLKEASKSTSINKRITSIVLGIVFLTVPVICAAYFSSNSDLTSRATSIIQSGSKTLPFSNNITQIVDYTNITSNDYVNITLKLVETITNATLNVNHTFTQQKELNNHLDGTPFSFNATLFSFDENVDNFKEKNISNTSTNSFKNTSSDFFKNTSSENSENSEMSVEAPSFATYIKENILTQIPSKENITAVINYAGTVIDDFGECVVTTGSELALTVYSSFNWTSHAAQNVKKKGLETFKNGQNMILRSPVKSTVFTLLGGSLATICKMLQLKYQEINNNRRRADPEILRKQRIKFLRIIDLSN